MTDQLTYLSVEDLQKLSLEQLRALWELVPTDRQKAYRTAYDREVNDAGAVGSDILELTLAAELLRRYQSDALVPVGSRWARTPTRVQEAARDNALPDDPAADTKTSIRIPPQVIIAGGVIAFLLLGWLVLRLFSGGGGDVEILSGTQTPTHTPKPEVSPTATPLAIEIQDDVIQGGDASRSAAYPVNLQVRLPDDVSDSPRVWVVQRRGVRAAEWNYDPNPDIASFVNGMSVRPVIGVPYSEDNAAWFERMGPDTDFTLTMNTGAILRFTFADKTEVRRSDTRIFRQVGPGLVLLLIGEVGADSLPTATRTLVTATYPPEQELSREGLLVGLPVPDANPIATPTPAPTAPFAGLDVQVIAADTLPGQLTTRLWIYNGGNTIIPITPDDIWLARGYTPNPPGPRIYAEGLTPFDLLPGQAAEVMLVWQWGGEPYLSLFVLTDKFGLE